MSKSVQFSRNQEQFVNALIIGKSITEAAKLAGVARATVYKWLNDPVFVAELEKRKADTSQTEQQEVQRILTSGYALIHKRVEALNKLAEVLEQEALDPTKRWLLDVKAVGFERVDLVQFNGDLIKEYRATFDDLAKELGQRVKKQEIEHSGLVELMNAEHASLLADLEQLPDGDVENQTTQPDAGQDTLEDGP